MDNFEAKLCQEVHKYPHLYDSSLTEYRDPIKIQNTWSIIAEKLTTDVNAVKKKWKYLRECYVKSRKSAQRRNSEGRLGKPIKYHDMLVWLSPFVKHRKTEPNM